MGCLRAFAVPAVLILATVTACGSSGGADEILDRLPGDAQSVVVLDVAAMADHYDLDRDELGSFAELVRAEPVPPGEPDPLRLLRGELGVTIQSFNTPEENAHWHALDVGEIDAVVALPRHQLAIVATGQDADEIGAAYVAAGFDDQGDGRYLHTATLDSDVPVGPWPAVQVDDGTVVLARLPESLDADDDGLPAALQTLVDAAGDAWAISATRGDEGLEADACGAGQAFVRSDDDIALLLLGGGEDVLAQDRLPPFITGVSPAEIDGDVTHYAVEFDRPGHEVSVIGSAAETIRLADC